jgi:hypothetical protein
MGVTTNVMHKYTTITIPEKPANQFSNLPASWISFVKIIPQTITCEPRKHARIELKILSVYHQLNFKTLSEAGFLEH